MKRSDLNQTPGAGKKHRRPRTLKLNWYIDKMPVKTEHIPIKELSHFTKIVAHHLTNMPIAKSEGDQFKLEVVIVSTEQSDLMWAIKSTEKINEFRKYLLRRGVNMKQIYLILQWPSLDSVIPLFEKEADESTPRPAPN